MWNRFLNESEIEVVVLMMAWDMLFCNEDYIIALIRSDVQIYRRFCQQNGYKIKKSYLGQGLPIRK